MLNELCGASGQWNESNGRYGGITNHLSHAGKE